MVIQIIPTILAPELKIISAALINLTQERKMQQVLKKSNYTEFSNPYTGFPRLLGRRHYIVRNVLDYTAGI